MFLQTCHVLSVVVFIFDTRRNKKSGSMQVVHLCKKGKDFKQKIMQYYIKIIKLGFAGWFKKRLELVNKRWDGPKNT